jgi:hypothetical protein
MVSPYWQDLAETTETWPSIQNVLPCEFALRFRLRRFGRGVADGLTAVI